MKRLALIALILLTPNVAFAAGGGLESFWANWAASMFNFVVFLGILWKFVLPTVQNFFADRRTTLMADLDEAKRLREEAQAKLDDYGARLDNLEKERQEIMDDYHAQGLREKEKLVEDANRQVEKMRKDAETLIASETRAAIASIEKEAVLVAVTLATDKVKKQMDDNAQNSLVDQYVTELKEMA